MLGECMELLNLKEGGVYADCTLGGGGHSFEILSRTRTARLLAIDKDSDALSAAKLRLSEFSNRVTYIKSDFTDVPGILAAAGVSQVDGALMDLGVSSYQLDNFGRGFSYRSEDDPLDMRMDREQRFSAYDVVNGYDTDKLSKVLWEYGEEKFSRRIAQNIARARAEKPLETCGELVKIVYESIPAAARRKGGHPAKRTFQAVRIEVNGELENLKNAVTGWAGALKTGGRLAVITFHSLEDRIVKHALRELENDCVCPTGIPVCRCDKYAELKVLTRKPVEPSAEETAANPRAQSAKLRAAEKTEKTKGGMTYHVRD